MLAIIEQEVHPAVFESGDQFMNRTFDTELEAEHGPDGALHEASVSRRWTARLRSWVLGEFLTRAATTVVPTPEERTDRLSISFPLRG